VVVDVVLPGNVVVVDLDADVVDVVDDVDVLDGVDVETAAGAELPDRSSEPASMTLTRKSQVRSAPEHTAPSTQANRSASIAAVPGACATKLTRVAEHLETGRVHSSRSIRAGRPSGRRIDASVGPTNVQFDPLRVTVMRWFAVTVAVPPLSASVRLSCDPDADKVEDGRARPSTWSRRPSSIAGDDTELGGGFAWIGGRVEVVAWTVVVVVSGPLVVVVIAIVLVGDGVVVAVRMLFTRSASRDRKEQTTNRTSKGVERRTLNHLVCALKEASR
jgi:hypothetical protein